MLYSGCINVPQRVDQRWVAPLRRSLVVGQLCGQTSMNRAHNPNPKNQSGLWICGPVQEVSACRRRRRSRNVSTKWWGDVDLGCGVGPSPAWRSSPRSSGLKSLWRVPNRAWYTIIDFANDSRGCKAQGSQGCYIWRKCRSVSGARRRTQTRHSRYVHSCLLWLPESFGHSFVRKLCMHLIRPLPITSNWKSGV
jgi:hypothetical protein